MLMKRVPSHIITAATAALVGLAPFTRAEHKNPSVGLYGQSLKSKAKKPDIFGKTKTTYQDRYGRRVGTATTEKPDIFGNRKTTHKGHNPFNFFHKKDDKKR